MRIVFTVVAAACLVTALAPRPATAQPPPSVGSPLKDFHGAEYFWQQLDVAKSLVAARDLSAIEPLESLLVHEDRHLRGNAAFVLAGLGDLRGFDVIAAMLTDRSTREINQGIPGGNRTVARQIESDRYYAVHLLGELRHSRAVDVLPRRSAIAKPCMPGSCACRIR